MKNVKVRFFIMSDQAKKFVVSMHVDKKTNVSHS
jgi:hypothetical protein